MSPKEHYRVVVEPGPYARVHRATTEQHARKTAQHLCRVQSRSVFRATATVEHSTDDGRTWQSIATYRAEHGRLV